VGITHEAIGKALSEFTLGRHRIEVVAEKNGITWIDDSKATNPHAATASILSALSVIWIAGGLAKGADINAVVARAHPRIKAAILIGTDRDLFTAALQNMHHMYKSWPLTHHMIINEAAVRIRYGGYRYRGAGFGSSRRYSSSCAIVRLDGSVYFLCRSRR
jgi:UDP-N-acetylmuramoylalanine-D-glutamate ligase